MHFTFLITHVPGKELVIADTLSCSDIRPNPSRQPSSGRSKKICQPSSGRRFVSLIINHLPASEQRLEIKWHQQMDKVCRTVSQFCESGWPERKTLSPETKLYFPMAAEFLVENDLLLRGSRIVIPSPLRGDILSRIHEGHQGITKCAGRGPRIPCGGPGCPMILKHW